MIATVPTADRRLQLLLSNAPVGLLMADAVRNTDGHITDFRYAAVNDKVIRILGLESAVQIEGKLMSEAFPQSMEPGSYFDQFSRALLSGKSIEFETSYQNRLGQQGCYAVTISPQDDTLTVTAVDITATRRAQLERQQQADRLERILDRIPIAVFVSEAVYDEDDPERIVDFLIRDVNVLGAQVYSLSRTQIVGRRASDLFPEDQQNGIFDRYIAVIKTQESMRFEIEFGSGPARHWVDVRLVPFDSTSVVATTLDISAIKQAQATLETINRNLQRSNENLERFAYVASHDLQEPLRKVQSFGDMLTSQYADQLTAEGVDLVRRMQVSAARMSVLIKDLLTFSRIATHQEVHDAQSLNDLIAGVLDDLDLVVRESGAQVYVEKLPIVRGDGAQLRQLFQNLLGNALKFRQPAVPPIVSITHRQVGINDLPTGRVSSVNRHATAFWEICVTDNGIGFEQKYVDRIFQVFQRLHGRSEFPGTGIGLAICQKVVENHAGVITADSKPGEGTTFRVYLPA